MFHNNKTDLNKNRNQKRL